MRGFRGEFCDKIRLKAFLSAILSLLMFECLGCKSTGTACYCEISLDLCLLE